MIKQENLFKKLGFILEELHDQYEFLAQNPQQLNELELDLFHANAVFLADHVQIIKKLNQQNPTEEPSVNETKNNEFVLQDSSNELSDTHEFLLDQKEEEVFVTETEHAAVIEFDITENHVVKDENELPPFQFILGEADETDKFEFEEKHVDEIFNRPLSEEEQRILAEKRKLIADVELEETELPNAEEEELGPEPFLVYKAADTPVSLEEPSSIAPKNEQASEANLAAKPTLNDLLASKLTDNSINATTNTGITDLKQGINLNDKLLYIKDLFNGYNLAYAEAIDLANKLPNFEAADAFFKKNYAVKNNWAEKQATVDKFYELLNQRFK